MSEEVFIDTRSWDEWIEANPNLVNCSSLLMCSTHGKEWTIYEIGWVEVQEKKDD